MSTTDTQGYIAPLPDMPCGCKLRVEELTGTPSERSRLYALGILPGTEVELCRGGCGAGSVCVRVRQCSLVLCEGMARGIYCRAEGRPACKGRKGRDCRGEAPAKRGCNAAGPRCRNSSGNHHPVQ